MYGVLVSYVEREVKYGKLDRDSHPDHITATQKASTKLGGGTGMQAVQLLGAMYNQLADMLIIQDRAFMLQVLCLMHEMTLEEVEEMLSDSIDLAKGFYTFDNSFNFLAFNSGRLQIRQGKAEVPHPSAHSRFARGQELVGCHQCRQRRRGRLE